MPTPRIQRRPALALAVTASATLHPIATACALVAMLAAGACTSDFSEDRVYERRDECASGAAVDERGRCTFGEEVYAILERDLQRSGRSQAGRVAAAQARKLPFIFALDGLFAARLGLTQDLLVAMLPLYDNDTLPRVSRNAADSLAGIRGDQALLRSLATLDWRSNYSSLLAQPALDYLLSKPDIAAAGGELIAYLLGHDGRDADGYLAAEPNDLVPVLSVLADNLQDQAASTQPRRDSVRLAALALTQDARLGAAVPAPPQEWQVRIDARGLPVPARYAGSLAGPFVDRNSDGAADADGLGRLVDQDGRPVSLPPFGMGAGFDTLGRALDPTSGELLYEYTDLGQTVLYAALQEAQAVVSATPVVTPGGQQTPHGLVTVLPDIATALVGSRSVAGADGLRRFLIGPEDAALLDTLYATGQLADFPEALDLLWYGKELLRAEGQLGPLTRALREAIDGTSGLWGAVAPHSTFVDELIPLLHRMAAVPGLLEDVLAVMSDPVMEELSHSLTLMMKYKRRQWDPDDTGWHLRVSEAEAYQCKLDPFWPPDPGDNSCSEEPTTGCCLFFNQVNHDLPDADFNVSYLQRLLKLFQDGNSHSYCPLSGSGWGCTVYQIDNLAAYHLDAVAKTCRPENEMPEGVVAIINDLHYAPGVLPNIDQAFHDAHSEVNLTTCPTAHAINHFVNTNHAGLGNVVDPWGWDYERASARVGTCTPGTAGAPNDCPTSQQLQHYLLREYNADVLFAADAAGLGDVLEVLLRPFSEHDCPYYDGGSLVPASCTRLVAELVALLSAHYPSAAGEPYVLRETGYEPRYQGTRPNGLLYAAGSDLRSHERALIALVESGELVHRLRGALLFARALQAPGGTGLERAAAQALRRLLTLDPLVTYRDGNNVAQGAAGGAISPINRFYVLRDALDDLQAALDASPAARRAIDLWVEHADGQLLQTHGSGDATTLRNRRALVLLHHGAQYLWESLADKQAVGALSVYWRDGLRTDVQRLIGGDATSSALALADILEFRPELRATVWSLIDWTLSDQANLLPTAQLLGELLGRAQDEVTMVPVYQRLGTLLDPAGDNTLRASLTLLDAVLAIDQARLAVPLGRSALAIGPYGRAPLGVLWDLVAELTRVSPNAETALEPTDLYLILEELEGYLRDEQHGVEKLYTLVANRTGEE